MPPPSTTLPSPILSVAKPQTYREILMQHERKSSEITTAISALLSALAGAISVLNNEQHVVIIASVFYLGFLLYWIRAFLHYLWHGKPSGFSSLQTSMLGIFTVVTVLAFGILIKIELKAIVAWVAVLISVPVWVGAQAIYIWR